jgi:hypothetical protein
MCEPMLTEFGSSKAPRDRPRTCGHRSKVSDTVDPQRGQKCTWTSWELPSDRCAWLDGVMPESDTASIGYMDSAKLDEPVTRWQNLQ